MHFTFRVSAKERKKRWHRSNLKYNHLVTYFLFPSHYDLVNTFVHLIHQYESAHTHCDSDRRTWNVRKKIKRNFLHNERQVDSLYCFFFSPSCCCCCCCIFLCVYSAVLCFRQLFPSSLRHTLPINYTSSKHTTHHLYTYILHVILPGMVKYCVSGIPVVSSFFLSSLFMCSFSIVLTTWCIILPAAVFHPWYTASGK